MSLSLPQKLRPGQEAQVRVSLTRANKPSQGIYAPLFPKRVDTEQWWVVLGDAKESELYVHTFF
jgi:hypothetical protein